MSSDRWSQSRRRLALAKEYQKRMAKSTKPGRALNVPYGRMKYGPPDEAIASGVQTRRNKRMKVTLPRVTILDEEDSRC